MREAGSGGRPGRRHGRGARRSGRYREPKRSSPWLVALLVAGVFVIAAWAVLRVGSGSVDSGRTHGDVEDREGGERVAPPHGSTTPDVAPKDPQTVAELIGELRQQTEQRKVAEIQASTRELAVELSRIGPLPETELERLRQREVERLRDLQFSLDEVEAGFREGIEKHCRDAPPAELSSFAVEAWAALFEIRCPSGESFVLMSEPRTEDGRPWRRFVEESVLRFWQDRQVRRQWDASRPKDRPAAVPDEREAEASRQRFSVEAAREYEEARSILKGWSVGEDHKLEVAMRHLDRALASAGRCDDYILAEKIQKLRYFCVKSHSSR